MSIDDNIAAAGHRGADRLSIVVDAVTRRVLNDFLDTDTMRETWNRVDYDAKQRTEVEIRSEIKRGMMEMVGEIKRTVLGLMLER